MVLLDAGGNLVTGDNTSALSLSIKDNPYQATIGPEPSLFVAAYRGRVQFSKLMIDRVGYGYTLQFTLYRFSAGTYSYIATNISVVSSRFVVLKGPSRQLVLHRPADGAWAGQQGFWTQPILWVTDYGNNIVTSDITTKVTLKMVSSLSVTRQIMIDTSDASISSLSAIRSNWDRDSSYSEGDLLYITITCPYRMTVLSTSSQPYLVLNISNAHSITPIAMLVGTAFQTKELTFKYTVTAGDYNENTDIISANALRLNDASIVDGNGNALNVTLPVANMAYLVNTDMPQIIAFTCNTTSGEYGAGQVIR